MSGGVRKHIGRNEARYSKLLSPFSLVFAIFSNCSRVLKQECALPCNDLIYDSDLRVG